MEPCAECSKWATGTKHEYFKVLIGGSQQLIPPNFYNYIEDRVNSTVLLTGSSGKPCTVQPAKINNGLCFKDGWRTFAEENSFMEEELLFGYDGKMSFTVEVFSNTACQRGVVQDNVNGGVSCGIPMIIDTKKEEEEESTDTSRESNKDSSSMEMHEKETKGKKPENAARKQKYTKYFISKRPVTREEKKKAFRVAASME